MVLHNICSWEARWETYFYTKEKQQQQNIETSQFAIGYVHSEVLTAFCADILIIPIESDSVWNFTFSMVKYSYRISIKQTYVVSPSTCIESKYILEWLCLAVFIFTLPFVWTPLSWLSIFFEKQIHVCPFEVTEFVGGRKHSLNIWLVHK